MRSLSSETRASDRMAEAYRHAWLKSRFSGPSARPPDPVPVVATSGPTGSKTHTRDPALSAPGEQHAERDGGGLLVDVEQTSWRPQSVVPLSARLCMLSKASDR